MPRVTITRTDGSTLELDTASVGLVERLDGGTVRVSLKGAQAPRDLLLGEQEAEPLTRAIKALIARGL